jgi:TIR domain
MIFISYAWRDAAIVRPFVRELQDNGLDTWVDFRDLDLTQDLRSQLNSALFMCQAVVLLESHHAHTSRWVQYERQLASAYRKRCHTVPVSEADSPNNGMHLMTIALALHSHR